MLSRDEFAQRVKETLAKRVGLRCSNPNCGRPTAGPHQDARKSVSIGVASHITAAAPGGPRFEAALGSAQRSGIANGLWLCQSCATLIDRDTDRHSADLLRSWKRLAEFQADKALSGFAASGYLPQPAAALHAPIPVMAGLDYHEARRRLLGAGWQPEERRRHFDADDDSRQGNEREFLRLGYAELIDAWPTGLAQCTFALRDAYGNRLVVLTMGEEHGPSELRAIVANWFFAREELDPDDIPARARTRTPPDLLERVAPGTPAERIRGWLGLPDSVSDGVWTYRFRETQVQVSIGPDGAARQIVVALIEGQTYRGTGAAWGEFTLGEMTLANLRQMGHWALARAESLRTDELYIQARVGPAGASKSCGCGALIVKNGAGALAPVTFAWDEQGDCLASDPALTLINYICAPGERESPWFDYFIEG